MFRQTISFQGLGVVDLRWPDFKATVGSDSLSMRFIERDDSYTIFALEESIAFTTLLLKQNASDQFAWDEYSPDYTKAQNDADRVEFETTYKATANAPIQLKSASRVQGVAAAKGLGGYLPNPSNNPYMPASDELVSLYVDGEGSLVTRGVVMTDEGSFRDDFSGIDLATPMTGSVTVTNGSQLVVGEGTLFMSEISRTGYVRAYSADDTLWVKTARIIDDTHMLIDSPYAGATVTGDMLIQAEAVPQSIGATPGTISLDGAGKLLLASGTAADCGVGMWRMADYSPMSITGWISLPSRQAEQKVWFGFRDDPAAPDIYVELEFTGIDDTKATFVSSFHGETETTEITLPASSSTQLKYRISVMPEYCEIQVGDSAPVRHELHIPDPYSEMVISGGIVNTATAVETVIEVDCVFFQNFDRIAVKQY